MTIHPEDNFSLQRSQKSAADFPNRVKPEMQKKSIQ